jgi:hypothetical protein
MSQGLKIGAGLVGAFTVAALGWYAMSPRVTERDASMRIVRGELVDSFVEPGVKWDAVLPHVEYIHLTRSYNETEIVVNEKSQQVIRLDNDSQIYAAFATTYFLDNTDPKFGDIFTLLRVDNVDEMQTALSPKINNLVLTAAIDVYKTIPYESMNKDLDIGKKIKALVEEGLADQGLGYVKIQVVMPKGVSLTPKANEDLEKIISERRKLELLDAQNAVALKSEEVALNQTKGPIAAMNAYKKELDLNGEEALQAYFTQLTHANGKVGNAGVLFPSSKPNVLTGPK